MRDDVAERIAGTGIRLRHRMNQRQGHLAFGQIITEVLAQGGRVRRIVQYIIGNLEGIAQIQAIRVQCILGGGIGAGQQRAKPGGRRKQNGGLAVGR